MMYRIPVEEKYIMGQLTSIEHKDNWKIAHKNEQFKQMSLFDDFAVGAS